MWTAAFLLLAASLTLTFGEVAGSGNGWKRSQDGGSDVLSLRSQMDPLSTDFFRSSKRGSAEVGSLVTDPDQKKKAARDLILLAQLDGLSFGSNIQDDWKMDQDFERDFPFPRGPVRRPGSNVFFPMKGRSLRDVLTKRGSAEGGSLAADPDQLPRASLKQILQSVP